VKRVLLPLGLALLAVTLALIAGGWLPETAQPVIIGVVAGMVASLPTSLIIVWRLTRRTTRPLAAVPPPQRPPTIVVVPPAPAPPTAATAPHPPAAPRPPAGPTREARPFTIIGGTDETGI
jgi:hypothetical protein